jgi:hypothetical protein
MLLPFWDGLVATWRCDPEMRALAERHYSRQTAGAGEFLGPGRCLVLRDCAGTVLFAWQWAKDGLRADGQTGYNCVIFRNEGSRLSSEIILEAEALAFAKWGANRCYTYVNPRKVRSANPGYCFKQAGWKLGGVTKQRGYLLLVKEDGGGRR